MSESWDDILLTTTCEDELEPFLPGDPDGSKLAEAEERAEKTKAHRLEVDAEKWRRRIRRDAVTEERDERDTYLKSDEGRQAAVEAFEADFIDLDDIADPEPLIDGFLYRETLVRTFGPPKSLKSFATLDMAACVSLGLEWHGQRTVQGSVLYVVAEGLRGIKKRRDAWNQHHETEMKVQFYPKAVQLGEPEQMYRLISYCIVKQIDYVVIDTQARSTVGIDENDNTEMGVVVDALDSLKAQTGACVHLVHHSVGNDDKKARGATAWDGAVDAEFRVKRDGVSLKFITKFQKDIGEADELDLITLEVGASLVLERDPAGVDNGSGDHTGEVAPALVSEKNVIYLRCIKEFGSNGAVRADIVRDLKDTYGITRSATSVKKAVAALEAGGALAPAGRGTAVAVTQAGLAFLDSWRPSEQGVIPGVNDTQQ